MDKLSGDILKLIAAKHDLSKAELKTLDLALSGKTAEEIATILIVSTAAIRKRLGSIYQKFHIAGNTPGKLEVLKILILEKYHSSIPQHQNLEEAPDVSNFYGRKKELSDLKQRILEEDCRLIALLGVGGIGKTALFVKLLEEVKIEQEFDYIVWKDLRNAPPISKLLTNLLEFFSLGQLKEDLPKDVDSRTRLLINGYLKKHRCLIVLDNLESILSSDTRAGYYRKGYEDYGEFLRLIGEIRHSSCVVLTSREKPKEIALLEGKKRPIKSLYLGGLGEAGREILVAEDLLKSNDKKDRSWEELIKHYGGNPLTLKIVAATIRECFGGDIEEFLKQGTEAFGNIRDLLTEQLERLTKLEREIMYWLAIEREPVSISELRENLVVPPVAFELTEAVESLRRRSLIEVQKDKPGFTLHNVVTEYLYDQLTGQICEEIKTEELDFFNNYALSKATAVDEVEKTQICLIAKPIKEKLLAFFKRSSHIEEQLDKIIKKLQKESPRQPGYAASNIIKLLCLLDLDLTGYDFSNLCVWQADLSETNLRSVNFAGADLAKTAFAQKLTTIFSVSFSPDGKYFVVGDADGVISLWKFGSVRPLWSDNKHGNRIRSVAFSPDGKMVVSGSEDKTAKLWDVETGECLRTFSEHKDRVWSVTFSPNGKMVVSGGGDGRVMLWDVETGKRLPVLQEHKGEWVRSVAFNHDGTKLAIGDDDGKVIVWNPETNKYLYTLQEKDRVWSVAFSPDGKLLASGGDDGKVILWNVKALEEAKKDPGEDLQKNLKEGKYQETLGKHEGWVVSVAFSPNGTMLASGGDDGKIILSNVERREFLNSSPEEKHEGRVWSVAFNHDSTMLVSSSENQKVQFWEICCKYRLVKTLIGYTNRFWSVAFSPDGTKLASGSDDLIVRVWDLETRECLDRFQKHESRVWSVAFSPDGTKLASSGDDGKVILWNVETGKYLHVLQKHEGWVWSVAFSPDGTKLASGGDDGKVILWNVETGKYIFSLKHNDHVRSVAFSPDGTKLASGGDDGKVILWDLMARECLNTSQKQKHESWVWSVAFSPDGTKLASSGDDGKVILWDLKDLKKDQYDGKDLVEQKNGVWSVAFNHDGTMFASGGDDLIVRVWDVEKGDLEKREPDYTHSGHTKGVRSVAFPPKKV